MSDYKVITDLRQRHIEKWVDEFDPMGNGKRDLNVQYAGQCVRAAIKAGIVEDLTIEESGELTTSEVWKLSKQVTDAVRPLLSVADPN